MLPLGSFVAVGDPQGGGGYVTTWPICGPLLIPPRCCVALGTPQAAGVMLPPGPFVGHF